MELGNDESLLTSQTTTITKQEVPPNRRTPTTSEAILIGKKKIDPNLIKHFYLNTILQEIENRGTF